MGAARLPDLRLHRGHAGVARQHRMALPDHRLPVHRLPVRRGAVSGRPGRAVRGPRPRLERRHRRSRHCRERGVGPADARGPAARAAARPRVPVSLGQRNRIRAPREQHGEQVRGLLLRV